MKINNFLISTLLFLLVSCSKDSSIVLTKENDGKTIFLKERESIVFDVSELSEFNFVHFGTPEFFFAFEHNPSSKFLVLNSSTLNSDSTEFKNFIEGEYLLGLGNGSIENQYDLAVVFALKIKIDK